jgi:hypothetical protein
MESSVQPADFRGRVELARKALDLLTQAAALASLPLRDHQRLQSGAAAIAAILDEAEASLNAGGR